MVEGGQAREEAIVRLQPSAGGRTDVIDGRCVGLTCNRGLRLRLDCGSLGCSVHFPPRLPRKTHNLAPVTTLFFGS